MSNPNYEGTQLECKDCDKLFNSLSTLHMHKISVHDNTTWKCGICAKTFANKYFMRNHISRMHNPNRKRYNCDQCDASFSQNYYLTNHMKANHHESLSSNETDMKKRKELGEAFVRLDSMTFNYHGMKIFS